ncbi:MAG: hypothetical protein V1754_02535 [Pseudomonadota bacterium]
MASSKNGSDDHDEQTPDRPVGGVGRVPTMELESTDRWIGGKSVNELLSDLKVYLARLRDNPHSLADRLRVASIQLRMGRVDEALVHYEGVLRGYVANGEILSAIALCERILGIYPDLPRVQRILAALYARAPHGSTGGQSPIMPIDDGGGFVVEAESANERPNVVNRIFSGQQLTDGRGRDLLKSEDLLPKLRPPPYPKRVNIKKREEGSSFDADDENGVAVEKAMPDENPDILLTHPKKNTE